MSEIKITPEYEKVFNFIEKKSFRDNILFISGKPGSGKSILINQIKSKYKRSKNIATLSPTGFAAIGIGGQTIHSFFGFQPTIVDPKDIKVYPRVVELIRAIDILIIDEISMVRADMVDRIDMAMKYAMNNSLPFGGKKVLIVGDLFQIMPVLPNAEKKFYNMMGYKGTLFFNSKLFNNLNYKIIILTSEYRQKDQFFKDMLGDIREGLNVDKHIDYLNENFYNKSNNYQKEVTLTTLNSLSDKINESKYNELDSKEFIYHTRFDENFTSNEDFPEALKLKVGAQVMTTRNHKEGEYVNGDICEVIHLAKHKVVLEHKSSGRIFNLSPEKTEKTKIEISNGSFITKVIGEMEQYPVRLAWAFSIHKSQGLSLNSMDLDMGEKGAFDAGQFYVALSRLRELSGLSLITKLDKKSVIINQEVVNFYKNIPKDFLL